MTTPREKIAKLEIIVRLGRILPFSGFFGQSCIRLPPDVSLQNSSKQSLITAQLAPFLVNWNNRKWPVYETQTNLAKGVIKLYNRVKSPQVFKKNQKAQHTPLNNYLRSQWALQIGFLINVYGNLALYIILTLWLNLTAVCLLEN